jgi:hypothetical protein
MIKRLATALAALALALGLAVVVGASPAQAVTCDNYLAPSAGHGLVEDNYGNWNDMAWTATYKKDQDHNSDCTGIKVWGFITSSCLYPEDGYTFARVRLFLSGGNESVGPLYQVYCGSSTQVTLTPSQPDGTTFRVETDRTLTGDTFNVRMVS